MKFCLIIISCVLTLLVLEGVIRVFSPHTRDHIIPGRLFEIDDYLGWKLKANKKSIHHSRYFEVMYTTNALGFRDKPRHSLKHKDLYRVLLYGDSQVFGWGISEAQRFSNLVESHSSSLELWNLAVPGYGLDQQVLSYERDGTTFEADEVIFFASRPTYLRNHFDYLYGKHKPVFVSAQDGSIQIIPPKHTIGWNLLYEFLSPMYLPHFVNRYIESIKLALKSSNQRENRESRTENTWIYESNKLEEEILNIAKNIAAKRNQQIRVLSTLKLAMKADLSAFCERNNIGFLTIDFAQIEGHMVFGPYDGHWNLQAHQHIAEQILSQEPWAAVLK